MPKNGILFLAMIEGQGEGFYEGQKYPRFFAFYNPDEIADKFKPYFEKMDYAYVNGGGVGYMLFVLRKV